MIRQGRGKRTDLGGNRKEVAQPIRFSELAIDRQLAQFPTPSGHFAGD